tara:strand:+ start:6970 stop:7281 length:312 start_codon:yes stop_codon:yes gene_type:complete
MSNDNLKLMYDKALIEAVKANDIKNKVVIVKLRAKCEFMRVERDSARLSAKRAVEGKTKVAKVLINMQLDGELNLTKQQIADKCSVTLQHIKNTYSVINKERR